MTMTLAARPAAGMVLPDPFPASQAPAEASKRILAPGPLIDRFPVVIGSGITLAYWSQVMRLATTGYRREYVDFGRELLERDGATKSLLSSRFATVAGGRLELMPATLPAGHPDEKRAKDLCDRVRQCVDAIPDRTQALFSLLWAEYYGVAAAEILYKRADDGALDIERLYPIANRRLAFPDNDTWDLHIWDQGNVLGAAQPFVQPTNRPMFGLNVARVPNKFVVHAPAFAADYPTREGMLRELGALMIFKLVGMLAGVSFVERFTRIAFWAEAATSGDGKPREANDDDYDQAEAALQQLGLGALAGAVLPDSIKLRMEGAALKGKGAGGIVSDWTTLIDGQIAVIVRGSNLSTGQTKYGSKSSGETGEHAEAEIERFSAVCLAETFRRDIVGAWMRINAPGDLRLTPRVAIHLDDPTPQAILDLYVKASAAGVPVDADACAEAAGLETVPNESGEPRRMAPLKQIQLGPNALGGDDAARAEEAEKAAQEAEAEAAKAKAEAAAKAVAGAANDNEPDDTDEPQAAAAE